MFLSTAETIVRNFVPDPRPTPRKLPTTAPESFRIGLTWTRIGFEVRHRKLIARRISGAPIKGESYFVAEITAGRVGDDQAPARKEFD